MHPPSVKIESNNRPRPTVTGWFKSGRFLPWLVLAISLSLTYHLWKNARQNTAQQLQTDFDYHVKETTGHIEQRMQAYEYVLRGAQGLFAASQSVGRNAFHSYVANMHLEDNYPGVQGVGFSLIVPPVEKDRHVAAVRRETAQKGHPLYTIRPEGQRSFYTSVVYLEPFSGRNLRAFGYDMYSEPVRRAAMEQARDTGKASISGKVRLVQETEQDVQAGFLMYLPVYRNGVLPGTVAERRANIVGWAYAPFRMNDLMHGIEGDRAGEIDADLYDGDVMSDNKLMYDTDNNHGESIKARFRSIEPVDIAGHRWTLHIYSNPAFEERPDTHKAELIALTGAGISLLLALLTWSLARGRERAMQAARAMNKELIRSEERARQAITASHSALWDYDLTTGRIYLSEGWSKLLGGEQQSTHTTIQELAALVPEEEQPMVQAAIVAAIKGDVSSSYQVTHRAKKLDGEYIWVLSEGRVTERDHDGWALRMVGTNRDITELKQTENILRESEEKLRALYELSPLGIALTDMQGSYVEFNQSFQDICGYPREELNSLDYWKLTPKKYEADEARQLESLQQTGRYGPYEKEYIRKDGKLIPIRLNGLLISGRDGRKYIWSIVEDITKRKQAEETLRKLSTAVEQSPTSVIITDLKANIQYVNPRFTAVSGYSADEVIGQNPRILQSGQTAGEVYQELWSKLNSGQPWHGEFLNKRKDGELYWEETYIAPVKDPAGVVTHYVAVKTDITARKQTEEIVKHMAHHDALTGLPNRVMLSDRLKQSLIMAKRNKEHLAVMLIDLDKFKPINDTYGHAVGDLLLQEVAKRIQDCVRESDTLSRLGGDEFVVLLPVIETGDDAMSVAEKILHALNQPFELAGHSLRISASIGVSIYPDHGDEETHLVKCADIAMYQSKKAGRDNVKLYYPDMGEDSV